MDPDTRVELLLVGLVSSLGVTDGGHKVVLVLQDIVTDTLDVGELGISVNVDLDDTALDTSTELVDRGTGTTVEDEENGLVVGGLELLLNIGLVLTQKSGLELDVTGLVDTVDVTESGGNGEVRGNGGELTVDIPDVLGLSVELGVGDVRVVDTVFLTTSDTDLHLDPDLHGNGTLAVLLNLSNVLLLGLLGQVKHVRREKRLTVNLEVGLIGFEHTVHPGEKLLGAVVRVHDDGDTEERSDGTDVVGSGDGTGNGGLLALVGGFLTSKEVSTTVGGLQDDGGTSLTSSLKSSNSSGGGGDVNGRDGESVLTSVGEQL